MAIEVRVAHCDDADAISAAHIDGWRVGYRHLLPDEFLDAPEFAQVRIDGWRAWTWAAWAPNGELFAAVLDGDVIGFGHAGPQRDDRSVGEVFGFYLHSNAWGSGVADALMTRCLDHLRSDGFDRAVLWVLRDNPRARRFYERLGWRPTGGVDAIAEVYGRPLPLALAEVEYGIALTEP
jgi:GNAT superfamily N-acetyltransferase